MRVDEITETELIARFAPMLPVGVRTVLGPGDDAAVLTARGDLVVTTDVLVEDHHFRTRWSTGADVGWRAAMQNLADVAAMGAVPTALVVALTLPPGTPVAWVEDLARGLAQACEPHGVGVVGGDLSAGPALSVAVTALGELDGRRPVTRGGARPGDVVAHAGVLGRSAAGLALLAAASEGVTSLPGGEQLVEAFRRPDPPLLSGVDAARAGASAMLDVSDGLLRDAGRIGLASGVRLDLSRGLLAPGVDALAEAAQDVGVDPLTWVLTGGEDHGLLATFPPSVALPPSFRRIGVVVAADVPGDPGVTVDGATWAGPLGWDHFHAT
ncbi:MAG: thiamine-phosphate kinase [Salana multivorans]|uniref:thiamine-phosphate kinase n=1 Tax=Salana multivorans TaxID=120377 RepID=UPI000962907A|nr:thiamine-phosphate kinase [Salana multivorans]MBN8881202.1 thiamine-phosphate kinase [Salana multivorans]OJX94763.1 MAG: thiamine-phosphate kinase [Micrococcales bacterium 73-15]